jgi:quinol monooxygenase YgiN
MIQIAWVIEAQPERLLEFQKAYGMNGDWVQLFRKAEGYIETALMRDTENVNRFLIIDRWHDLSSFDSFKRRYEMAYNELDHRCEEITRLETKVGTFRS